MHAKDHKVGFLEAIAAEPYDPSIRLIYHDWLLEAGDQKGALQQKWIGCILMGRVSYDLVITHRGVLEAASSGKGMQLNYWLRQAHDLLNRVYPDAHMVIISSESKMQLNLRLDKSGRSPVIFYRSGTGGYRPSHKVGRDWRVEYYRWRSPHPWQGRKWGRRRRPVI
jgi:uncharacterized protein (TIGR02996 family)